MGAEKRAHIAAIAAMPEVAAAWRVKHRRACAEEDIDAMYAEFIPLQIECLPDYADLVPGAIEAVSQLRRSGMKIGTTTGYSRAMMDVLAPEAARRGFVPDAIVCADEVPAGRPEPWMALRVAEALRAFPPSACVKVGDTVPDILEGLNAGMLSIGVAATGNEVGLSLAEYEALDPAEREALVGAARSRLAAAGAHQVVDSIADIPALLDSLT
jgi:phosphonoacetaldehyde hydrolase